ncbi:hypothetical protein [Streptomyces bobili]
MEQILRGDLPPGWAYRHLAEEFSRRLKELAAGTTARSSTLVPRRSND